MSGAIRIVQGDMEQRTIAGSHGWRFGRAVEMEVARRACIVEMARIRHELGLAWPEFGVAWWKLVEYHLVPQRKGVCAYKVL
jgi:hypothetical protein